MIAMRTFTDEPVNYCKVCKLPIKCNSNGKTDYFSSDVVPGARVITMNLLKLIKYHTPQCGYSESVK